MGKIQKMVDYAVKIANDDSHGYSQSRRWETQGTDRDCSSLMYDAAHHAGYNVTVGPSGTHYTGTMIDDFRKAGFKVYDFDGNLNDLDKGDILVRDPWGEDGHTEMYIGNGKFVGAHGSEYGTADGAPGDQTGDEISVCNAYGNWDYVLEPPKEGSVKPVKFTDGTYTALKNLNIRAKRAGSSTLVCTVAKGSTLKLDAFTTNSAGNTWARITTGDHKGRYVCVKSKNGANVKKK